MKLTDLVDQMDLEVRSARQSLGNKVTGGYMSDLLSDVLAHSSEGNLWITLQRHHNIVAVASLKQLAGIVLVAGREPEEETVEKAEAESLPILVSELPAFELAGRLYTLGVRGTAVRSAQDRE